ncbi:MAG TPA: AMP-binding protein [Acidimicrobiia bacterium]|nr:AMP-binding protein [Acidimicrobiia bacterium]
MHVSQAQGSTEVPLLEETIGENLEHTTARFGDRDALIVRHQGIRCTYREFDEATDRLAKAFLEIGVELGDRVGMWSPNNAEWVAVQYATAKIGGILVNINAAYRTAELEYVINQSGCRFLISAPLYLTSDYRAMVNEVRDTMPQLERVIFLDSPEWNDLFDAGDAVPDEALWQREALVTPDQPINIQYTSGTTGFPKGATLSHRSILNNGFFCGERLGYTERDRVCIPVPFYHCFGMVIGNLACTTHGAAIVVPSPGFDAGSVLEAVEVEACTSLYGVPTMFIATLEHEDLDKRDVSSLRTGVMAGAPCPIEVMNRVMSELNMSEVTIAYGMTELSPVATQTLCDDPIERRVSTVGTAHPFVEIKIVDPDTGETTPTDVSGEFCARGYSVMQGYWDEAERTAESIDSDGWMHSGDLAVMDDAGYVKIVGRLKDMIIRGGDNVYPREIEEYLFTHPDVVDAQVIGVPDERFGEQIMAWVQKREGSDLTETDVIDYCKGRIAHFKVPRYVRFTDTFPMTVTGKIQKFKLKERAIEELGLADAAIIETA